MKLNSFTMMLNEWIVGIRELIQEAERIGLDDIQPIGLADARGRLEDQIDERIKELNLDDEDKEHDDG